MKKWLPCLFAALACLAAGAQTPDEILEKMSAQIERSDAEGLAMVMDIKIPILGTISSKVQTRGKKSRVEFSAMGQKQTIWSDGVTEWSFDEKENTLTIKNDDPAKGSDAEDNLSMFSDTDDGYDSAIRKETADEWHIRLTKKKTNTDKDDPKTMDFVVNKADYMPKSLSASIKGIKVIMHGFRLGVSEKAVTFTPDACPGAVVKDERP